MRRAPAGLLILTLVLAVLVLGHLQSTPRVVHADAPEPQSDVEPAGPATELSLPGQSIAAGRDERRSAHSSRVDVAAHADSGLRSIEGIVLSGGDERPGLRWISVRIAGQPPRYVDPVCSDEVGRFEIEELEPAVYELLVDYRGLDPQRFEPTTVTVVDCRLGSRTDVVVRPTPFDGQPVTGALHGVDPDEIGWTLSFVPLDAPAPWHVHRVAFVEEGQFAVSLLVGRHAVVLGRTPPMRLPDIFVPPGGGEFDFELPTGRIAGRTSEPIEVRAVRPEDRWAEEFAEGPARWTGPMHPRPFQFTGVESGRWVLLPGGFGRSERVFRPLFLDLAPGQEVDELALEVIDAHRLDLRVVRGSGDPALPSRRACPTLYIRTPAGSLLTPDGVSFEPDDMWLPPGDYTLTLVSGRDVAGPVAVRVGEPGTRAPAPVQMTLAARRQ